MVLGQSSSKIPPRPSDDFIYDVTRTLYDTDKDTIGELQKTAYEVHDTPIIVVTIDRMADYKHTSGIEVFAKNWFDEWGIGAQGSNKGILFLISMQDRKARIELGADWGRKWDDHCQRIMNDEIVPRFKENRYPDGIVAGVRALADMAAMGPNATPPGPGWSESFNSSLKDASALSYFQPSTMALIIGLGLVMIVAGIFLPGQRSWLIGGGVALIVLAIFTYVIVAILAVIFGGKGKSSGIGGGYSSSGGFSGGFSGGGGASGSW